MLEKSISSDYKEQTHYRHNLHVCEKKSILCDLSPTYGITQMSLLSSKKLKTFRMSQIFSLETLKLKLQYQWVKQKLAEKSAERKNQLY